MPKWKTKPLGELCQLINGRAFKPSDWGTTGLPIVRIQNLNDETKPFNHYDGEYRDKHFIDDGEILLSWSGTPGTSFGCFRWNRGPAILNQHIFKVVPTEEIDGDFFIHAVNSQLEEMIAQAHGGVGLRHITKSKLQAMSLACPELPIQRQLVAKLDCALEQAREIESLRENTISDIESLRLAVFADYVETLCPQGRSQTTLGDVLSGCKYGSSSKANVQSKGWPILRMGNIKNGRLSVTDLKHLDLPDAELQKYRLADGDILVNRTNSLELVGKSAVFKDLSGDWVYASYLIRLRVDPELALPEYVNAVINSRIGRHYVYTTARRAIGMVNINATEIRKMPMPLPSLDLQIRLIEKMGRVDSLANDLQACVIGPEVLLLRKSILRKAFAGEL